MFQHCTFLEFFLNVRIMKSMIKWQKTIRKTMLAYKFLKFQLKKIKIRTKYYNLI
jgi:hypothetical protein